MKSAYVIYNLLSYGNKMGNPTMNAMHGLDGCICKILICGAILAMMILAGIGVGIYFAIEDS